MTAAYTFLPELFLRAPYYSFSGYDLDRLPEVLASSIFRNAIYLASPDFYRVLEKADFVFERLSTKARHTLYKYYNRMCFRPVPFGSFASFSLLEWGEGDTVRLGGDERAVLHLLPDESLLTALGRSAPPPAGEDLLIRNPTLYLLGKEYRYIKSTADAKGHYQFSIDALPAEKFHRLLFRQFKDGRSGTAALLAFIEKQSGCSAEEAADYLGFLLEEQVIYPSSRRHMIGTSLPAGLPVTVKDYWAGYRDVPLCDVGFLADAAGKLRELAIPEISSEGPLAFYAALERRPESGGPGSHEQEALSAAIGLLQKLALPFNPPNMEQFVQDFRARFDLEQVPLLKALDPDAGTPYGTNGLSGFTMEFGEIRFPEAEAKTPALGWSDQHRLLFRLWANAQKNGPCAPIDIQPDDLAGIGMDKGHNLPPSTLAVMFRKTEDHLVIDYAGGSAAATALIGRFSAFSPDVLALCRRLAALEQAADHGVVFADIGQLSDLHSDNINRREAIYPFEIPLNVFSVLPPEQQILPEDLLVSVRNGQVLLESVKLGKRVIPRLATAYNHRHNGLSLFRFLADLQYQEVRANLTFSMESYFPGFDFYPRVLAGGVIICLARWHIGERGLSELVSEAEAGLPAAIRDFRSRYGLPQRISLGNTDQQLVFDLGDLQECRFFVECIRGLKKVTLVEYLLPGRSLKTGNKPLAGQYVALLSHALQVYPATVAAVRKSRAKKERNFLPGGEWLYVKIYCTPESADLLLAEVIGPVIRANRQYGDHWFFIRYFDKAHHLRLRFRMVPEQQGQLLAALKKSMQRSGHTELIRDYQGDIYRREMERYSGDLIEEVEAVFCAGSRLSLAWTGLAAAGKTVPYSNFQLGVVTAFRMAGAFFSGADVAGFFRLMSARFLRGFSGGKPLRTELDNKYRDMRKDLAAALELKLPRGVLGMAMRALLDQLALVGGIATDTIENRQALLADLIHMQLNRTFQIKQRQQELMVYYFLEKYTTSKEAQSRVV
jgi:thiopeptide-type bacteriocin biosynthesis protein